MPAQVQTSGHQHLLSPSPSDLHIVAIRWQGVPPATSQKRFSSYLLPVPGKELALRLLASRGTALAAQCFPRVAPSLWFTSCTPTSMSRQLEGCAEAGGCLEIRTTPPVSSRRGQARFVLGVVKDMDFGGVLLPHFLGTLAQGQVTPWWGCVLTSYSHCLRLASPLHPVPCRNPRLGGHRAAPGCAFETRGSLGSSTAPQRPGRRDEGPVSL